MKIPVKMGSLSSSDAHRHLLLEKMLFLGLRKGGQEGEGRSRARKIHVRTNPRAHRTAFNREGGRAGLKKRCSTKQKISKDPKEKPRTASCKTKGGRLNWKGFNSAYEKKKSFSGEGWGGTIILLSEAKCTFFGDRAALCVSKAEGSGGSM